MATDTTRDAAPAAHDIGSILNALSTQHTYLGGGVGWFVAETLATNRDSARSRRNG